MNLYLAMSEYFGLQIDEYIHLFSPGGQNVEKYQGNILEKESTPEQISLNIYAFLKVIIDEFKKQNIKDYGKI